MLLNEKRIIEQVGDLETARLIGVVDVAQTVGCDTADG